MIGRAKELKLLETLYGSNSLQVVILQGESGIGKTHLINSFCKRKRKAYYCLRNSTNNVNKSAFTTEMLVQGFTNNCFDWKTIIDSLCRVALGEKLIIVLDDIQYADECFEELMPQLLNRINNLSSRLRLLLILSGSSIDKIIQQLIFNNIKYFLMNLQAISFMDFSDFFSNLDIEQRILLYGVTGGHPDYMKYIDNGASLKDNLYSLFFCENAPLIDVGQKQLEKYLRQPMVYHAILCSVAYGAVHMKDIAIAVGIDDNRISKYVNVLVKLGFLKRLVPVNEQCINKNHKNTFYIVNDNMMLFWYSFVFPYLSTIKLGMGNQIIRTKVLTKLDNYVKKVFLEVCFQHCYVLHERGNFYVDFTRIGFLWPKEADLQKIRIGAYSTEKVCYIQCVWDKNKVDWDIIADLMEGYHDESLENYYIVFSRKGFTERALANEALFPQVRLISLRYLK